MKLVVLCAALLSVPAFADSLVAREGRDTARLLDEPCRNERVLGHLEPQLRPVFKAASVVVDGQTFSACWGTTGSAVYLLYEDGDEGLIPLSKVKPELSA